LKKSAIQILAVVLVIVGLYLSMTAFAWSIEPTEMLFISLWIATIIGLILSFSKKNTGIYTLMIVSVFWLLLLAEKLGWFLTFEPENIALMGIFGLPVIASVLILIIGSNLIFDNKRKTKFLISGIGILIPIVGILSFANKTYDKNIFSEFYELDSKEFRAVFKPQPADSREFEMKLESEELRDLVINKATFVANHHYFPNAKFRVKMTFSEITEIELYKVSDFELKKPLKWKIEELNGETEFLK
jgi:hypothetical protein